MLPALLVVVLALRRSGEACHRKVSPRSPPRVPATARTQRRVLSFLRSRCGGEVEMRVMGSLATGRRCHLLCSCTRVHADFGVTPGASIPTPLPARRLRASASRPLISSSAFAATLT